MYLEYEGTFARIRRRYFRKIIGRLKEHGCSNLLDYGCGPGDVLLLSNEAGLPATGIDSFPRSVAMAESRGLHVILGDERSEELKAASFDAILLQSVLEHVHDPVALLHRLEEKLTPGGILVLSAPTPCSDFWNDPTHVRPFTPRSFRILGEILGLEVMEVNYVFSYLLGLRLEAPAVYKFLNFIPVALGSNLIAFYRKPMHEAR